MRKETAFQTFTFMLLALLCSCSSYNNHEQLPAIEIISNASYKYDLKQRRLSVFSSIESDTTIKFHLAADKYERIKEKYYRLKLNEIQKPNLVIRDECLILPRDVTILKIVEAQKVVLIQLDLYCDKYKYPDRKIAKRVKEFVFYVKNMIDSLPEIKNAPKSDILYM